MKVSYSFHEILEVIESKKDRLPLSFTHNRGISDNKPFLAVLPDVDNPTYQKNVKCRQTLTIYAKSFVREFGQCLFECIEETQERMVFVPKECRRYNKRVYNLNQMK